MALVKASLMWLPTVAVGLMAAIFALNFVVFHMWQYGVMSASTFVWAYLFTRLGRAWNHDGVLVVVRDRRTVMLALASLLCVAVCAWAGWMIGGSMTTR
jgi:hypothetical protein